jgi:sec-independent protein translocase protein TatA
MFITHSSTVSAYQNPSSAATVRAMISFVNGPELIIVLVVVLVIFGGSQLPKLAKNLGSAQKEFKKAMEDEKSSDSSDQ